MFSWLWVVRIYQLKHRGHYKKNRLPRHCSVTWFARCKQNIILIADKVVKLVHVNNIFPLSVGDLFQLIIIYA